MSRKRTPLHQSINSLAASLPDIPSGSAVMQSLDPSYGEDSTVLSTVAVSQEGDVTLLKQETFVGGHCDHETVIPISAPSLFDLFTTWSRTPEGHQARDSRIPTDPVRLGCILDDNARIAFMAGYAAATPSFE